MLDQHDGDIKRAEMLSMFVNTTGGGLGLLMFGWISNRIGRKGAFVFYHLGALMISLVYFKFIIGGGAPTWAIWLTLPVFGFLTLGMHAGYAVYFPELYPTRLRGTGAGFCFNMGRLVTFPMLLLTGWMQRPKIRRRPGLFAGRSRFAVELAVLARRGRGVVRQGNTRDGTPRIAWPANSSLLGLDRR